MSIIAMIFNGLGALGMFLIGMRIMSDGIQKVAGAGLQAILNHITSNRFVALLTGLFITAIIQSSSATTVMVISFANAGLLNLTQSIGVIMGADIGTTITGWIVALLGFKFSISAIALPILGVGFPLYFSKRTQLANWGEFAIGFGLLFLGLSYLKHSVPTIDSDAMAQLMPMSMDGPLGLFLFVLFGAVLTALIHSSSASMAIVLTMANNNIFPLVPAMAMVLGCNIGTTIDAFLASLATNIRARRAAYFHIFSKIIWAVLALIFFRAYVTLIETFLGGMKITSQLAAFHTIFNVVSALLFLPFVSRISTLLEKLVQPGKNAEDEDREYHLEYLAGSVQSLPEMHLLNARHEVYAMAVEAGEMFRLQRKLFEKSDAKMGKTVKKLRRMEDYTDQMQEQISSYLIQCDGENLSPGARQDLASMLRIINELESVGDSCYNLSLLYERRYIKKITLHKSAEEELAPFMDLVDQFIRHIISSLNTNYTETELDESLSMEQSLDEYQRELKKRASKYIQRGKNVKGELLYIDMLRHLEHIGDYCLNIAQELIQMRESKLVKDLQSS